MSSRDQENAIASLMLTVQKLTGDRAILRDELRNAHKGLKRKQRQVDARDREKELLLTFIEQHQLTSELASWMQDIRDIAREAYELEKLHEEMETQKDAV